MWKIKELHVHPMEVFALILAADNTALFACYVSLNTCRFNLPKIFAATIFYDSSCGAQLHAMKLMERSASFIIVFAVASGVSL